MFQEYCFSNDTVLVLQVTKCFDTCRSLADPLMIRLIHNDQKRVFVVFEDETEQDENKKYIGREVRWRHLYLKLLVILKTKNFYSRWLQKNMYE